MQFELHHGDCLEIMRGMEDNSVDLILTDPPYFKVKGEPWDNQWAKPTQFLAWLDTVLERFQRILKPNGSLYLFASPQMACRVETLIGERFNVLNNIRWYKDSGWHKKARKEDLRSYLTPWEACIFAEQRSADSSFDSACDQLWGRLSVPLRGWFHQAWEASGLSRAEVDEACGTKNVSQYWFLPRGYQIPTADKYKVLQRLAPSAFSRDYADLRAEFDQLRAEFDQLRRQFAVTADTPHTDLWTFDPVRPYPGKHPCEKPAAMLEHIITASSRPGAVVFDAFAGSGSTGIAALKLGRKFIGCEMSGKHHAEAVSKIADSLAANDNQPYTGDLFAEA